MNSALRLLRGIGDPATARKQTPLLNGALLVLLVLTWAISWPVIKVGVTAVPPIWFGCLRYAIATLCIFALLAIRGGLTFPPRTDWPLIAVSGALQMAAYSALTALALVTLPPGRASVLAFSTPIWVVPLAAFRLREHISVTAGFGVGAGLLGVGAIAVPSILSSGTNHALAYLMLIGASLAWATSILFVRMHRFTASTFELAPWQMLIATVLLFLTALPLEGSMPELSFVGLASLAFVGPVATGFAYWAVVEVGRHFRASTISMALLATPSLGILISALTLGEAIDLPLIIGVFLVGWGIWLTTAATRQ